MSRVAVSKGQHVEVLTQVINATSIICKSEATGRRRRGEFTVIPTNPMTNESSGPNTDRYKQTSDNGTNNANKNNGMLLA